MKSVVKKTVNLFPTQFRSTLLGMTWKARTALFGASWRGLRLLCQNYPGKFPSGGPARGLDSREVFEDAQSWPVHCFEETDTAFLSDHQISDFADEVSFQDELMGWQLQDVIVDGKLASVHNSEGDLILKVSPYTRYSPVGQPWDHPAFVQFDGKSSENLKGVSLLLASPNDAVYFHWLLEVFPRLKFFEYLFPTVDIDRYLVRHESKMAMEALAAAGVSRDKVYLLHPKSRYQCETLMVCSPFHPQAGVKVIAKWMQETFLDNLSDTAEIPVLLISRGEGTARSMVGEEKLAAFVEEQGGRSVILEKLSLCEQASLFQRSRVIIAGHGSSLTNLVFCRPGTHIIELFSANFVRLLYPRIGKQLGLQYHCYVGPGEKEGRMGLFDSIVLEDEVVENCVRSCLSKERVS